MSQTTEIKSEKILLQDVFKLWFRIPEYQRPYVWGAGEVHELLDDLSYAATNTPDAEYFLGSFVFQTRPANSQTRQLFEENDLLDGQQRLTTLLLIFAVIRDISHDAGLVNQCQELIYQEAKPFQEIPSQMRLIFNIRPLS